MKALAVVLPLVLTTILTTSVFGQTVHRNSGSVVFPGGTSSTASSITRNFGSVVFPGGGAALPVYTATPVIGVRPGVGAGTLVPVGGVPASNLRRTSGNGRGTRSTPAYVYAYPMYIGGYDNSYASQSYATQEPAPQPPNVTVVYPPQQQQATPVMIQAGPDGEYTTMVQRQPATIYEAPRRRETAVEEPEPAADSTRYLLAFKDHTIYSAVAYWADGDTLHYFTMGNTHNQVSMSLVDRQLTERLNRELGIDFKLPPVK
jgi:hypothetical protein